MVDRRVGEFYSCDTSHLGGELHWHPSLGAEKKATDPTVDALAAAVARLKAWSGPSIPTDLAMRILDVEREAAALAAIEMILTIHDGMQRMVREDGLPAEAIEPAYGFLAALADAGYSMRHNDQYRDEPQPPAPTMTDPALFYCVQCGVPLPEEGAFCPLHVDTQGIYPALATKETP